jgi:hypothetical protein
LYIGFGTNTYDVRECAEIGEAVLRGYRKILSLSDEEFHKAMNMRLKTYIFSHWLEDKYYKHHDSRANKFLKNSVLILDHFCQGV